MGQTLCRVTLAPEKEQFDKINENLITVIKYLLYYTSSFNYTNPSVFPLFPSFFSIVYGQQSGGESMLHPHQQYSVSQC